MATITTVESTNLGVHLRVNPEFYLPKFLHNEKFLDDIETTPLQDLSKIMITKGETPLWRGDAYMETGIPFLRSENLTPGGLDLQNLVFVSEQVHQRMRRSKIRPNDFLLAIVGATIGQTGLATDDYKEYNCNQAIAIVRPEDEDFSSYLAILSLTRFVQLQIERLKGGGSRDNLDLHEVRILKIPKPSNQLLAICLDALKKVRQLRGQSQELYIQAQQKLLDELGIKDLKLPHELTYAAELKGAVNFDRIDAEYYQPKYLKLLSHLKKFSVKKLGELATLKKGIEVGSEAYQEEGIPFVRVSSLSPLGLNNDNQQYLSENLYNELKDKYEPRRGELLLTKDASPGVAYVLKDQPQAIISGGVLRLKVSKDISPEYLALILNSLVGRWQTERDTGGSVIVHWRPEQIKEVIIPVLDKRTQEELGNLATQSYETRNQAKKLLDEAKRKVEELIES